MAYVLIVEDDRDAQQALSHYLGAHGHQVAAVGNGQDALNSILSRTPDAIVLDLLMSGLDGTSLLEIIRSYLRLRSIPVIVWTAAQPGPILDRARDQNPAAVFTKPSATLSDIRFAIEDATGQAQVAGA